MNNIQFPKSIRKRITNEFLQTFKEQLELAEKDESTMPEHPTYWNYYQWFDNTCGFDKALKIACELHSLNDLYEYRDKSGYPNSDVLGGQITELLYKRGIINEGSIDDPYPMPFKFVPKQYTEEELEEFYNEMLLDECFEYVDEEEIKEYE